MHIHIYICIYIKILSTVNRTTMNLLLKVSQHIKFHLNLSFAETKVQIYIYILYIRIYIYNGRL